MKKNQIRSDRISGESDDFGSFLKYLRLRAGLGQRDLGIAVGYGEAQISRLEHNHRLPDLEMVRARFIPALELDDQPELAKRLVELARRSLQAGDEDESQVEEMGILEAIPSTMGSQVARQSVADSIQGALERNRVVLVYGFPGVGKSALCGAIMRRAYESKQPVFWHTAHRADPAPFETLLRQLALFLVAQGVEDAALWIQPGGLPIEAALSSLAEHLRSLQPLVCVDEFHHLAAREQAVAMTEKLIGESRSRFLFASRERVAIAGAEAILLTGMSEKESRELAKSLDVSLADDAFHSLFEITQGNPMMLKLASQAIRREPAHTDQFLRALSTQREVASFLVENALQGLPPSALNLLSLISIFRQPVNLLDIDIVQRLREAELVTALDEALSVLQKRQFFDNPVEARLHPLLKEHLEAILNARPELHRALHELAARHLRAVAPHSLEALHHLTQANDAPEVLQYVRSAHLHWDSTGQGEYAADLIASMLNRTRNTPAWNAPLEAQLLSYRGQLLMSGRRAAEAEADFRQALSLANAADALPPERFSISLRLARFLLQRGKAAEADQLCDEAERIAASNPDPSLLAEAYAVRCTLRLIQSRFDDAAGLAQRALDLAEPLEHTHIQLVAGARTMAYNTLGIVSHIRRDIPAALAHWRNAEDAALLAGNLRTAFRIKGNIGGLRFDQGELDDARQTYEEILDATQALGDIFALGKILNALGAIYHLQARPAEALELLDKARKLKRLIGDAQGEATTDNQRAQVLLGTGRAAEARQVMERLLKQTEETGETRWRASYLDTLGMILLGLGEFDEARLRLEEASSLPGAAADPQLNTYLRNHLALACLGLEEAVEAEEVLTKTEGMLNDGMVALESRLVHALVLSARGRQANALAALKSIEEDATRQTLCFFAGMARHAREAIKDGNSIGHCVSVLVCGGALEN